MNIEHLSQMLTTYLTTRAAIGFKDRRHRKLLEDFLQHLARSQPTGPISAQLALDWACSTPHLDAVTSQAFRLSVARGFLTHVKTVFPETELPPARYLRARRRPTPYLFSRDDILRLLDCAGNLRPRGSIRPHTYRTLIGLLACTGLRASEAVRLRLCDIQLDIDPPVLHIFETKFLKSRWVPLHTTTATVLREYKDRRCQKRHVETDQFFISAKGKPIPYYTLKNLFARLVRRLGIAATDQQRNPSLHSLRHSFAVQRLTTWYREGRDVQSLAPHLSVYLGHARLADSYWYLSALPDLLKTAGDRFYAFTTKGGDDD